MSVAGIECNRNKDIGTGYLSITVKVNESKPWHYKIPGLSMSII